MAVRAKGDAARDAFDRKSRLKVSSRFPPSALKWPSSSGQMSDTTGETVGKTAKTGVSGFAHGVLLFDCFPPQPRCCERSLEWQQDIRYSNCPSPQLQSVMSGRRITPGKYLQDVSRKFCSRGIHLRPK